MIPRDAFDVLDLLAVAQGCFTFGLSIVAVVKLARDPLRRHVLAMVASYSALTLVVAYTAATYMEWDQWRLWVSLAAWGVGDVGMLGVIVMPSAYRKEPP